MELKFKATDDQMVRLINNAVQASNPMGLGWMQANTSTEFTKEDFDRYVGKSLISVDYFEGRMVKLVIIRESDYYIMRGEPRSDYQSWVGAYPSYEDLLMSVEFELVED